MIFDLVINTSLISVGIAIAISAILGGVVFINDTRSHTNIAFILFSLAAIAWNALNFLFYQPHDPSTALVLLRLQVFAAVWYCFTLLTLFFVFPEEKVSFPRWYKYILLPLAVLASAITLTPFAFKAVTALDTAGRVMSVENSWGVGVFGGTVVVFLVVGFVHLIQKMRESVDIDRKKLSVILSGAVITFILHIVFNMVLPAIFNISRFTEFGALFTLPFSVMTSYAIIKFKLFNVKVVSTELLTFALWIFILIRTLSAEDPTERFMNGAMLFVIIVVGILLIRSVMREVKQRERLEILSEALEQANEKLRGLDKLKTEFLSLASHQLRSPLTAIKGYTSMLLEGSFGSVNDEQKGAIDRVFQSSVHLAKVVEDLLNVSKIEQGGLKYEMAPFDFEKASRDLTTDLAITAEKKGLSLTFSTDNTGPYTVNGDMEKIRQVILNIIDNSIKYTQKGSISVILSRIPDRGVLRLAVTDTGMGISPEEKQKLFQKFGRGAGAKENTGGSGLGLYLAKQIAEAHGGSVTIDSPGVGLGSTFSIELKSV